MKQDSIDQSKFRDYLFSNRTPPQYYHNDMV